MKIRVASNVIYESCVNGDGIRNVVFLSGCDKNCPGCHNEYLKDFNFGADIEISDLVKKLTKGISMCDGVTISGGDPLCQYEKTLVLCKELKKQKVNIWLYTGETYNKVIDDCKGELLKYIDVLVDGPYIEHLNDGKFNRGSSNQRILYLKNGDIVFEE